MSGTTTVRTERRRFPRSERAGADVTVARPSWVREPRARTLRRERPDVVVIETDRTRRDDELDAVRDLLIAVAGDAESLARLNRVLGTCDRHVAPSACRAIGCVTVGVAGVGQVDRFVAEVAALDARRGGSPDGPTLLPARRLRAFLVQLELAATAGSGAA